ncbi:MAG TPA: membrane protein insertion efficiency factor YidD [Bacteroidota bacterium]|nr:membrane protein insertion efficiency factor YidD [Bacteroidota bacterium]
MKDLIIALIRLYQTLLSPILPFNNCRFYPSCSQYTIEAIEKHGAMKGLWLAVQRILSCHPLSKKHGYDPVP